MLREWATNSDVLREVIHSEEDGIQSDNDCVKILGLNWDFRNDFFSFPTRQLHNGKYTKREIVRNAAHVFDPLGFLLPVTIRSRILIQKLWKAKYGWDEEIDSAYQKEWDQLVLDYASALQFQVPRRAVVCSRLELHAFCDASTQSYGAVVYGISNQQSYLLMSKARVAPIKVVTVPQLELTAASISARLVSYVVGAYSTELEISRIIMWSDSQVVLRWLESRKPLLPYVRNRVDEVHKLVPTAQWRYVPTKENPSDMISQGVNGSTFLNSKGWLNRPPWLTDADNWPEWEKADAHVTELVVQAVAHEPQPEDAWNGSKYSQFRLLLKVTILVHRFVSILRKRDSARKSVSMVNHQFSLSEWELAELFWVKHVQLVCYSGELSDLRSSSNNYKSALISQLNLKLEEDVLRCVGRLQNSNLDYASKYPILLSNKHWFTLLLIKYLHEQYFHQGANFLINLVRQKYWIPHLRSTVKSVLRRCVVCRKLQGSHYQQPPSASLPKDRIQESRPFSVIGVDYTGSMLIKEGKEINKVYVVLFTCALTRAVHLELVRSNSAEDFMNAFRRFIGRRSLPRIVYSDNAQTFRSTSKHLTTIQNHPELQAYFTNLKISWNFIPAKAPWYGGFWERLIGQVKMSLKKALGQSLVNYDELHTLLVEVESILNNRPLTYVSDQLGDLSALTPSELVYGFRLNNLPTPVEYLDCDVEINRTTLTRRQRKCRVLLDAFWKRWKLEYLSSLRERHAYGCQKKGVPAIKMGDVVLISNDCPRSTWKMGVVTKLHQGTDLVIRSASVKTTQGEFSRSVLHLYPLEIQSNTEEPVNSADIEGSNRPRRLAAERAKVAIAKQAVNS